MSSCQNDLRRMLRGFCMGVAGCSGVLLSLGCGSDTTGPGAPTLAQQYWQLTLNHHAITLATLAPYDTIQLIATPRTITGDPIVTADRPTFTTSDTSITIDSMGLVKVHGTTTKLNITVVAKLAVGGVTGATLVDTAMVNVVLPTTSPLPVFTRSVFQPTQGDSARRSAISLTGATVTQALRDSILDAAGRVIPNARVRYSSSDPLIAKFATASTPTVTPVSTGIVTLTAEATVYGVRKVDTLQYLVGANLLAVYGFGTSVTASALDPNTSLLTATTNAMDVGSLTIGVGGSVLFSNYLRQLSDDSLDIVFDTPVQVGGLASNTSLFNGSSTAVYQASAGGNIPPFGAQKYLTTVISPTITIYLPSPDSTSGKARVFSSSGDYPFHSVRHPAFAGVVHVVPNASIK